MLLQNIFIAVFSLSYPLRVIAFLQKKTHTDKPTVSIRFEPPSPIIENDHTNVTMHCDVVDGNPGKLLKVQWMMNDDLLAELPVCDGKEESPHTFLLLLIYIVVHASFITTRLVCVCVCQ